VLTEKCLNFILAHQVPKRMFIPKIEYIGKWKILPILYCLLQISMVIKSGRMEFLKYMGKTRNPEVLMQRP
jgi:hypothetical protein